MTTIYYGYGSGAGRGCYVMATTNDKYVPPDGMKGVMRMPDLKIGAVVMKAWIVPGKMCNSDMEFQKFAERQGLTGRYAAASWLERPMIEWCKTKAARALVERLIEGEL